MYFRLTFICIVALLVGFGKQSCATDVEPGNLVKALKDLDSSWTDQVGSGKAVHMNCKSNEGRLQQEVVYRYSNLGKICKRVKSATGLKAETTVFKKDNEAHSVVRRPEPGNNNPSWAYSQAGEACLSAIFSDEQILLSSSRIGGVPLYEILESIDASRLTTSKDGSVLSIQFDAEKPIRIEHGMMLPFLDYPCSVSLKLDPSASMRILECQVIQSNPDGTKIGFGFENKFNGQHDFRHVQYSGLGKERKVRHDAIVKQIDAPPLTSEELTLKHYGIEFSEQVAGRSFPWLLVIGGLVLVGGIVLKLKTRRVE